MVASLKKSCIWLKNPAINYFLRDTTCFCRVSWVSWETHTRKGLDVQRFIGEEMPMKDFKRGSRNMRRKPTDSQIVRGRFDTGQGKEGREKSWIGRALDNSMLVRSFSQTSAVHGQNGPLEWSHWASVANLYTPCYSYWLRASLVMLWWSWKSGQQSLSVAISLLQGGPLAGRVSTALLWLPHTKMWD